MTLLASTPRTSLRRRPQRGSFDPGVIHAILDEAPVCHVGFATERGPVVIPTAHARVDDRLYLHGAAANGMLRTLSSGIPVCVTVTLLDGLVFARSAFHHSMNYRSVVLFGTASKIEHNDEKQAALLALVDHIAPGRSRETRPPSELELRNTLVVSVPITEASAKVRAGPPVDAAEDLALPYWAGEVPLRLVPAAPVHVESKTTLPASIRQLLRRGALSPRKETDAGDGQPSGGSPLNFEVVHDATSR